ncbi:unnamed protein product [Cuscuta epithymum]|uniref:TF-B3 domain-containing protein n=1 Tax=Cuscuta epithymum TaxID=186058 RepID=A0AAV0E3U3_9ASTE|nr:unnamed protein product [Cuscuta epithymum]
METQRSNFKELSVPSPTTSKSPSSSSSKTKRKMPLQSKRKLVSKKPEKFKSEAKQVKSNNPRKPKSVKRKRATTGDVYDDDVEAKFSVLERAERVMSRLSDEFPIFLKCMLPSNVAHGFWLHLPKAFTDIYLPSHDTNITLVDEWGNEYKTSYLMERHGLSAGWRAFSISHRLLKGDLLIFCLIEPCKLKVDIVRVNGPDVVDAALCLLNLDGCEKIADQDHSRKDKRKKTMKFIEPYIHDDVCKPEERHVEDGVGQVEHYTAKDWVSEVVFDGITTNHQLQCKELGDSRTLLCA